MASRTMRITPPWRRILRFVAYQGCWAACVLGAGTPVAPLGVIATGVWIALEVRYARHPRALLSFVALNVLVGDLGDRLLIASGAIAFFPAYRLGYGPYPLWMDALWAGFGVALKTQMPWLLHSRWVFFWGALLGPIAYAGGTRLGPLEVSGEPGYVAVALVWGVALLLLQTLSRRRPFQEDADDEAPPV